MSKYSFPLMAAGSASCGLSIWASVGISSWSYLRNWFSEIPSDY
jgi:hypothetical protein